MSKPLTITANDMAMSSIFLKSPFYHISLLTSKTIKHMIPIRIRHRSLINIIVRFYEDNETFIRRQIKFLWLSYVVAVFSQHLSYQFNDNKNWWQVTYPRNVSRDLRRIFFFVSVFVPLSLSFSICSGQTVCPFILLKQWKYPFLYKREPVIQSTATMK